MQFSAYKERAIHLRKQGKSYGEIQNILNVKVPKSTLSLWCVGTTFTDLQFNRIEERIRRGGEIGRATAVALNRERRSSYLVGLYRNNFKLRAVTFSSKDIAKIVLTTLYLAEGSKSQRGKFVFGNSDPNIIKLFMKLLRFVYAVDNSKFRCTVQCRADQNIPALEKFWSRITKVPLRQFYKARVDPRSIGKISLKKDYKAVCRIDYFSASVYNDLLIAGKVITGEKGPVAQWVERPHGMREARGS